MHNPLHLAQHDHPTWRQATRRRTLARGWSVELAPHTQTCSIATCVTRKHIDAEAKAARDYLSVRRLLAACLDPLA